MLWWHHHTDLLSSERLLMCAGVDQGEKAVRVLEHEWGTDAAVLGPAFDVIVACGMALQQNCTYRVMLLAPTRCHIATCADGSPPVSVSVVACRNERITTTEANIAACVPYAVSAADVMYIDDAVQPLVQTLAAVSDDSTRIYIAHGRNRQAEASFLAVAREDFDISELPSDQLDDVYQCSDVAVWLLKRRMPLSQP